MMLPTEQSWSPVVRLRSTGISLCAYVHFFRYNEMETTGAYIYIYRQMVSSKFPYNIIKTFNRFKGQNRNNTVWPFLH